ncbi:phosphatase PAP2 family protein [Streptomyces sp. NPDC088733]|uniref:phosphatase PAP2 family protein n=1 Tax=Streptomyces sp. NPDC088733 TaxID=3365880 RepID=UPI0037F69A59
MIIRERDRTVRLEQEGPASPRPAVRSLAKLITDVLAPAYLLTVMLLAVGWHSGHGSGLAWAAGAAAGAVGVPMTVVVLGVRAGRFTDVHVRIRRQRAVPLATAIACAVLSVVLLALLGAPRELTALVVAILSGLTVGGLVTIWWKVSGHTAAVGAAGAILTAVYGAPMVPLLLAVIPVGWSRVVLRDHTVAQTVVGFLIGSSVALAIFLPLR